MRTKNQNFSKEKNASTDSLPIHNDEYERKWKGKNKQSKISKFFSNTFSFDSNSTTNQPSSREAKKQKKRLVFYSLLVSLFIGLFGLIYFLSWRLECDRCGRSMFGNGNSAGLYD